MWTREFRWIAHQRHRRVLLGYLAALTWLDYDARRFYRLQRAVLARLARLAR